MPEARHIAADELRVGLTAEFTRDVGADDIRAFAALSEDWNPLHTDAAYAAQTNYGRCIVHGAFQVGLASAMVGMFLPGRDVVVASFQCRFPAPLFYPTRVRVVGEITAWSAPSVSGTLRVRVVEVDSGKITAEVHVGFSLHEHRRRAATAEPSIASAARSQSSTDTRPIVLVTGASGGLGRVLTRELSTAFRVIPLSRSVPPDAGEVADSWVTADLHAPDWESTVTTALGGQPLFGIVHAAWPSGPTGGLLEVEDDAIRAQVESGGVGVVRLARWLRTQAGTAGGRLVILGTTAATIKPVLNMAAYSLGKAALEHTVRLIAPELGRSNITVNLIAPSFVPVGMNETKTNRVVLTETAKVPLGRLCTPEDIAGTARYLLSPDAAFLTGQVLALTGGQL